MIARYNLRQTVLALVSFCIGVVAFMIAWRFFFFAGGYLISLLGSTVTPLQIFLIAWTCCAVIAVTGWHRWKSGRGYHTFHESGMMPAGQPRTGIAWQARREANRLGAWAYLLGQIFLAGPLQILGALDRLHLRIPSGPTLDARLLAFHDQLRETKGSLSVADFPGREQEIGYLVRLGLVDFSPRKATFKLR